VLPTNVSPKAVATSGYAARLAYRVVVYSLIVSRIVYALPAWGRFGGAENAGVENAGAITYGKPKIEKRLTVFTASNLKSLKYIIISLTSNVVQLHIIIYGISGHPQ